MQMVADLADRINVLNYGRTLASGTPAHVLADPAVIAAYLGRNTPH
jgi:branched-chain amino acid transport system ATP-binding protein